MPNKTYALEWMNLAYKNLETARLLINEKHIQLTNIDLADIIVIGDYYETDRYPGPRYSIPTREEVEKQFDVAETIYDKISSFINT